MSTAATTNTNVEVNLEFTPNPETLKYSTNLTLIPSGIPANFTAPEKVEGQSELADQLFKFSEVSAVMVGKDFVTLTLRNQDNLMELNQSLQKTIREFLESGRAVVQLKTVATTPTHLTDIEKKICEILDNEIRPAVAMDGGDISFEKYEDGFVYLKMQGSCSGCPSSMMTLKVGVESRLKEAIPEIQEVIPV